MGAFQAVQIEGIEGTYIMPDMPPVGIMPTAPSRCTGKSFKIFAKSPVVLVFQLDFDKWIRIVDDGNKLTFSYLAIFGSKRPNCRYQGKKWAVIRPDITQIAASNVFSQNLIMPKR
jgi:hypothetical protein